MARQRRCAEYELMLLWKELADALKQSLRELGVVVKTKAVPENRECRFDWSIGGMRCKHKHPPVTDCRQPLCDHAIAMRTRGYKRLIARYAPGVKPRGVE